MLCGVCASVVAVGVNKLTAFQSALQIYVYMLQTNCKLGWFINGLLDKLVGQFINQLASCDKPHWNSQFKIYMVYKLVECFKKQMV